MFEIIRLIFAICIFKKSPQDLPHSLLLVGLLVIINIITSFLILKIQSGWLNSLIQAVVGIILLGGFSWICLFLCRKLPRFYQTASALLGVDAMIGFFALPAVATMVIGQGGLLVFLIVLALIGWHWAIIGHIMRNALEQSLSFSLGLAFLYLFGSYQLMALLFPEVANTQ
ncbi:MAG: hypothetical protein ACXWT3_12670 [Methylococcaceae bacterium]